MLLDEVRGVLAARRLRQLLARMILLARGVLLDGTCLGLVRRRNLLRQLVLNALDGRSAVLHLLLKRAGLAREPTQVRRLIVVRDCSPYAGVVRVVVVRNALVLGELVGQQQVRGAVVMAALAVVAHLLQVDF